MTVLVIVEDPPDLSVDHAVPGEAREEVQGGLPQLQLSLEELVAEVEDRPVPASSRGRVVVLPQLLQLLLHEPGPQSLRGGGQRDSPHQSSPGYEGWRQGAVQVEVEFNRKY